VAELPSPEFGKHSENAHQFPSLRQDLCTPLTESDGLETCWKNFGKTPISAARWLGPYGT